MPCSLCGHVFAQKHRILPGSWGGTYEPENVIRLCPNHHAAIHAIMNWHYRGRARSHAEERRILAYADDRSLWVFWLDRVKPIVEATMKNQGRLVPHMRTLPSKLSEMNAEEKAIGRERTSRAILDDDRFYRAKMDGSYILDCLERQGESITPEMVRSHPLLRMRDEAQMALTIGYLMGLGKVRPICFITE
jgi:hypothetical protein